MIGRRKFVGLLAGAVTCPLAARAQQSERVRRIVVVQGLAENDSEEQARITGFRETLAKLGWIEGRNLHVDYRWSAIDPARARTYVAEIIGLAPDAIFVNAAPVVAAIRDQISTTPIVFIQTGDPVRADSVRSFARPGGNLTGFVQYEPTIAAKYLQLLKDMVPNVTRVAVLQFENSTWRGDFAAIKAVAPSFAVTPISAVVHDEDEIEQAIVGLAREPNGGLIVPPDNNTLGHRNLIIALAARHGVPAIYAVRAFVAGGGLMSYAADSIDLYRRAAAYVDRILRCERPGDLPVQAPTKYLLVINLSSARALGLNVSPTMLIAADEVIE